MVIRSKDAVLEPLSFMDSVHDAGSFLDMLNEETDARSASLNEETSIHTITALLCDRPVQVLSQAVYLIGLVWRY